LKLDEDRVVKSEVMIQSRPLITGEHMATDQGFWESEGWGLRMKGLEFTRSQSPNHSGANESKETRGRSLNLRKEYFGKS
jgi:hypothetical protein